MGETSLNSVIQAQEAEKHFPVTVQNLIIELKKRYKYVTIIGDEINCEGEWNVTSEL